MRITEEFRVKDAAGHEFILQNIADGISYLDFGNTHLPRDFHGYRVKHLDKTAEPLEDGAFRLSDSGDVLKRI